MWNFAKILGDDGVGYGDYLEQITYLLFLKMADDPPAVPRIFPSYVRTAAFNPRKKFKEELKL